MQGWKSYPAERIRLFVMMLSLLALTPCLANAGNWHAVASLGAGAAIASDIGQSRTFPIINPVTDEFFIYRARGPTQTVAAFDAFVGAEWRWHPQFALQTGLAYNGTWHFQAKGSLLQGADFPSADQWAWHYDILTRQLLVEGKLLYHWQKCYHPYVLLGIGAAFNQASDYATNIPPFLTFTREYQDGHTEASFSFAAGIGIDVDIREHFRLGAGYRFADAGKVSLSHATIDTTPVAGTLSQNHLYINELIAQITYIH